MCQDMRPIIDPRSALATTASGLDGWQDWAPVIFEPSMPWRTRQGDSLGFTTAPLGMNAAVQYFKERLILAQQCSTVFHFRSASISFRARSPVQYTCREGSDTIVLTFRCVRKHMFHEHSVCQCGCIRIQIGYREAVRVQCRIVVERHMEIFSD